MFYYTRNFHIRFEISFIEIFKILTSTFQILNFLVAICERAKTRPPEEKWLRPIGAILSLLKSLGRVIKLNIEFNWWIYVGVIVFYLSLFWS